MVANLRIFHGLVYLLSFLLITKNEIVKNINADLLIGMFFINQNILGY